MAEFSAPFDGATISTELQWSRMARRWGLDGVHALDATSTALKVTGSGAATVSVAPGHAFVNGFYYYLDAAKNVTVTATAGGAARVDYVVLRASMSANSVTVQYKTGGLTAPTLTQDEAGVWEIPIAQCTVAAGSSVVTAANVIDKRYLTGRGVIPSIGSGRPPSIKNQLLIEDGRLFVGDGATWKWLASVGMEDDIYTPTWYAGSTVINWGSGSVNVGHFQVINKRVDLTIQLEPTGNPPALDDPIEITLPPGLPCTSLHRSLFKWNFTSGNDEGSAVGIGMSFPTLSTSRISRLRFPVANGSSPSAIPNSYSVFTNAPFNIRSGDVLTIDGSYWL